MGVSNQVELGGCHPGPSSLPLVRGSPGRQDSPYGCLDVDPGAVVVRRNASRAASTARDVVSVSSPLRTMRATGGFENQAATQRGYLVGLGQAADPSDGVHGEPRRVCRAQTDEGVMLVRRQH
jgi:hypothetical protein